MLARVCLFLGFIAVCAAHATLVVPLGWNAQPSTARPCGGATKVALAQATWVAGSRITIQWRVVAGDGVGDVTLKIDPAGGVTFTDDLPGLVEIPGLGPSDSVSTHSLVFDLKANVNCSAAPDGLCTIQARSASNWQSCSTVSILPPCQPGTANCTIPPPAPPRCVRAQNLGFCKQLNNRAVYLPAGVSPAGVDAENRLTYNSYLANRNLFTYGNNSAECSKEFFDFLCTLNSPPCPGSDGKVVGGVCQSQCESAMHKCGLNATHLGLYPCDSYPPCASSAIAIAPLFVLILMSFLAVLF